MTPTKLVSRTVSANLLDWCKAQGAKPQFVHQAASVMALHIHSTDWETALAQLKKNTRWFK